MTNRPHFKNTSFHLLLAFIKCHFPPGGGAYWLIFLESVLPPFSSKAQSLAFRTVSATWVIPSIPGMGGICGNLNKTLNKRLQGLLEAIGDNTVEDWRCFLLVGYWSVISDSVKINITEPLLSSEGSLSGLACSHSSQKV